MLTVAHTVEECGERTKVLGAAATIEQVRVNTLQLVHDGAHILDTVGKFHTQGFFNHPNQRMAVHHGRKIVQTVGEGQ